MLQGVLAAKPLDGSDAGAVNLCDWHEARVHRQTVNQHRAGAALSFAAPFLRSRKLALQSKNVEQPGHRWRLDIDIAPVHTETHAASAMRSGVAGI